VDFSSRRIPQDVGGRPGPSLSLELKQQVGF